MMTLQQLDKMVQDYRTILRANKIPCGRVQVKLAPRNARYFAQTEMTTKNIYIIKISAVAVFAGQKSLKNTILHELCHTCRGCFNHGAKFKKYGQIIEKLFDEKIETYATETERKARENYKAWQYDLLFKI